MCIDKEAMISGRKPKGHAKKMSKGAIQQAKVNKPTKLFRTYDATSSNKMISEPLHLK